MKVTTNHHIEKIQNLRLITEIFTNYELINDQSEINTAINEFLILKLRNLKIQEKFDLIVEDGNTRDYYFNFSSSSLCY